MSECTKTIEKYPQFFCDISDLNNPYNYRHCRVIGEVNYGGFIDFTGRFSRVVEFEDSPGIPVLVSFKDLWLNGADPINRCYMAYTQESGGKE